MDELSTSLMMLMIILLDIFFSLPNSEPLQSGPAVFYVRFLAFLLGCSFTIFLGVFISLLLLYLTSFSFPGFSLHLGETYPLTASQDKVSGREICTSELFSYYGHVWLIICLGTDFQVGNNPIRIWKAFLFSFS